MVLRLCRDDYGNLGNFGVGGLFLLAARKSE
jgi:hypothetical protein